MSEAPVRRLVLFDGVCGLCDRTVRFLILCDRHAKLRFSPLQGALAKSTLGRYGIKAEELRSVVFVENAGTPQERVWMQSDAVFRIFREIGGLWAIVGWLRFLPRFLRDTAYDFVARHRHSWFGSSDVCRLPTPETKDRFVE